jgi:hypothetical protein
MNTFGSDLCPRQKKGLSLTRISKQMTKDIESFSLLTSRLKPFCLRMRGYDESYEMTVAVWVVLVSFKLYNCNTECAVFAKEIVDKF